jgi:hypothetical protein
MTMLQGYTIKRAPRSWESEVAANDVVIREGDAVVRTVLSLAQHQRSTATAANACSRTLEVSLNFSSVFFTNEAATTVRYLTDRRAPALSTSRRSREALARFDTARPSRTASAATERELFCGLDVSIAST